MFNKMVKLKKKSLKHKMEKKEREIIEIKDVINQEEDKEMIKNVIKMERDLLNREENKDKIIMMRKKHKYSMINLFMLPI